MGRASEWPDSMVVGVGGIPRLAIAGSLETVVELGCRDPRAVACSPENSC